MSYDQQEENATYLLLGEGYHKEIVGKSTICYHPSLPSSADCSRRQSISDDDTSSITSETQTEFGYSFIKALSGMPFSNGTIDLEQYQAFSNYLDQSGNYVCEDLFGQPSIHQSAEIDHSWQHLQGLPTPPSTPEKLHLIDQYPIDNQTFAMEMRSNEQLIQHHQRNQHNRSSPSNLQVVPDSIPQEKVEDILPWLNDLESQQAIHSPHEFFKTAATPSPSHKSQLMHPLGRLEDIACEQTSIYATSKQSSEHLNSSPIECHSSIARFNETPEKPCYNLFQNGASFPSNVQMTARMSPMDVKSHGMGPTVVSSPLHQSHGVPECMLSPISPTKSLKRTYAQISPTLQQQQPRPIMPTSRVSRELFPVEFLNNNLPPQDNIDPYTQHFGGGDSRDETDSSGEGELSRATHNVLERQRRNDLKMRFHILRDNLPDLISNEKAPKIQILKKAHDHVKDLQSHEQRLLADKELERQRKLILIQRLQFLRQGYFDY